MPPRPVTGMLYFFTKNLLAFKYKFEEQYDKKVYVYENVSLIP
jgi:hypothetical protein